MNILFITPPPSLPSGFERIRALNFVKALGKKHKVYLLPIVTREVSDQEILKLCSYCEQVSVLQKSVWRSFMDCALFLFSPLPLEIAYCRSRAMTEKVRRYVKRYAIDVVYVKRLRSAQFIEGISCPVIIDTTDAMSLFYGRAVRAAPWYQKPLYSEEAVKYRWYEKKMLRKFKNWVVSSSVDADYLRAMAPSDTLIHVVSNGVDMEYFRPGDAKPDWHTIIFSGLMDKFVNIEAAEYFAKEIFPLVLKEFSDARLFLVGPNPARRVRKLAAKNVTVTGLVDDIRPFIVKSEVVVCPVKTGTGTRNKVLQAWAMKKPVVTTSQGIEGLDTDGVECALIRDTPAGFAQAVVDLFHDDALAHRVAEQGYLFVQERYSMDKVAKDLEDTFVKVCATNPS